MPQRRERICYHELFKKNILQGFPGSVQGCAPLSAVPEAEDRQLCKGPAGSHSKEKMQQSSDHHRCRYTKAGADRSS